MGRRPKKKTIGVKLSINRDIRILLFLWKWKVTTSSVLMHKFFKGLSPFTAYRRLWVLEKAGCIESKADSTGQKFIWTLGKRGFTAVQDVLFYKFKENGYKSESPGHDLLVAAFHLGDWVFGGPPGVGLVSEQQLRRCEFDDLPDWLPRIARHRPDGFTYIPNANGTSIFAIEVELNIKDYYDYSDVAYSYSSHDIDVLWLVPRASMGMTILKYIRMDHNLENANRHSFVSFPEFLKSGWGRLSKRVSTKEKRFVNL